MIRILTTLLISTLMCFVWPSCTEIPSNTEQEETPPNLILIIADDMAWNDCGAYGHPHIRTPNMDRLAREGMRFDRAFLTTSSCSPSRSSIITGKYPHQTNAEQLHWPLPADNITFPEKLKEAGYWTALGGKYHLGDEVRDRFDVIQAVGTAGFQLSSEGKEVELKNDGSGCESWVPLLQHRPKDKPFFLWLAAVDPHRAYKEGAIEKPYTPEEVIIPPYMPDTEAVRGDFALYYEEITRLDNYIGKVLQEIENQGIAENTFILFITDNGRPFPRDKTTLYDGGIKTPWIVRWPKKVKAGSTCDHLVSSVDIAPTYLHLAGVEPGPSFVGKNFMSLLETPEKSIQDFVYAEDHWHDVEDYSRAVRTKQFKYIKNFFPEYPNTPPADALRSPTFTSMKELRDQGKLDGAQMLVFNKPRPEEELFDVEADPNELNNLASDPQFAGTLKEMRKLLEDIRTKTNDQLPSFETPDEFDRETGLPLPTRKRPRASKKEMMESLGK